MDYSRLKVVEQLRNYGFNFSAIEENLKGLSEVIDSELFFKCFAAKKEDIIELYDKEIVAEYLKSKEDVDIAELLNLSVFEMLILNAIMYNDIVSILFFSDFPGLFFPISGEVYKVVGNDPEGQEYLEFLERTHLSISISQIIKKFVEDDLSKEKKGKKFKSVLSEDEYNLLKIVRKKYNDLKKITIRFQSNEMKLIEVSTTKKTTVESRLLEHIKKGDYLSIQIESENGNIVNFENTQKIKL